MKADSTRDPGPRAAGSGAKQPSAILQELSHKLVEAAGVRRQFDIALVGAAKLSLTEHNQRELLGENRRDELRSTYVLNRLRKQHEKTPLYALYAKAEFPTEGTVFKLGGRQRELGYIQIDLVKGQDGWTIDRICIWH